MDPAVVRKDVAVIVEAATVVLVASDPLAAPAVLDPHLVHAANTLHATRTAAAMIAPTTVVIAAVAQMEVFVIAR
jgi:hypothetical protein